MKLTNEETLKEIKYLLRQKDKFSGWRVFEEVFKLLTFGCFYFIMIYLLSRFAL